MGRVERRRFRRRRRRTTTRILLSLSVLVIALGLYQRTGAQDGLNVSRVAQPTATPLSPAYDETVIEREVTLPETTWYALQTGIFSDEKAARNKADAYAERGAQGIVVKDGERYRVFIAAYAERTDAAAIRERLNSQQAVETYLFPWSCPAVILKMSGMAGQADVVESGLGMAMQAAVLLRDYAIAYDQGGITAEDAVSLISSMNEQFALWTETVSRRFGQPYPGVIDAEMALARRWQSAADRIMAASKESGTSMSAEMKCQAMTLYAEVIAMRNHLEST